MKAILFFLGSLMSLVCFAQQPMPPKVYQTMHDSTTSIDVVFYDDEGGSISAEGKDVSFFNYFFANQPVPKSNAKPGGSVMWLINGREFLSGAFFLGDTSGYLVTTTRDGYEYVNKITPTGFNFLKGGYKKH